MRQLADKRNVKEMLTLRSRLSDGRWHGTLWGNRRLLAVGPVPLMSSDSNGTEWFGGCR